MIKRAELVMLNELQTWWQDTTPETRTLIADVAIGVAAFLGGLFAGGLTRRSLRSWHFDGAFRLTHGWSPTAEAGGPTPTRVAALLVWLTVWAAAAGWFAHRYGHEDIAATIGLVITRTWSLT